MLDDFGKLTSEAIKGSEFGLVAVVGSLMGLLIDKVRKNLKWYWRESGAVACMAYIVGQVAHDVTLIHNFLDGRWGLMLMIGVVSRPIFDLIAHHLVAYVDRMLKILRRNGGDDVRREDKSDTQD